MSVEESVGGGGGGGGGGRMEGRKGREREGGREGVLKLLWK